MVATALSAALALEARPGEGEDAWGRASPDGAQLLARGLGRALDEGEEEERAESGLDLRDGRPGSERARLAHESGDVARPVELERDLTRERAERDRAPEQ